jgi:hypothetical protein
MSYGAKGVPNFFTDDVDVGPMLDSKEDSIAVDPLDVDRRATNAQGLSLVLDHGEIADVRHDPAFIARPDEAGAHSGEEPGDSETDFGERSFGDLDPHFAPDDDRLARSPLQDQHGIHSLGRLFAR